MPPLSLEDRAENWNLVKDLMLRLTGDRNVPFLNIEAVVTAIVKGKTVIDGECIPGALEIGNDTTRIHMYWEDADIVDYKKRGLFGTMSGDFQTLRSVGSIGLDIIDAGYVIELRNMTARD